MNPVLFSGQGDVLVLTINNLLDNDNEQGLKSVVADLERFGGLPAPLLEQLADEGKTFGAWDKK